MHWWCVDGISVASKLWKQSKQRMGFQVSAFCHRDSEAWTWKPCTQIYCKCDKMHQRISGKLPLKCSSCNKNPNDWRQACILCSFQPDLRDFSKRWMLGHGTQQQIQEMCSRAVSLVVLAPNRLSVGCWGLKVGSFTGVCGGGTPKRGFSILQLMGRVWLCSSRPFESYFLI